MAPAAPIESLPGFRRRFRIAPAPDSVLTELEDDYHCMAVRVVHDGDAAIAIEAIMDRAPWTTCPGGVAQLERTFTGVPLARFAERGEKAFNCTHLHDLATLGAVHAGDDCQTIYDILVADEIDGLTRTELRRNGATVMAWTLRGFEIVEPAEHAGIQLIKLGPLLAGLSPEGREQARLLRWGTMVAHGRAIPLDRQSDPMKYPGNCYTFQPETAARARRVGEIREFSRGTAEPLDRRPQSALAGER